MRGTFFSKPLEFKLEINGESWLQGETISGSLSVTNQSKEEVDLSQIGCHLCYCVSKKFKAKDPKAITLIESQTLASGQSQIDFNFKLNENCKITEGSGNFYIICGDINTPFEAGALELNVQPSKVITNFVNIFEQFYRFKLKAFKNKKSFIEAVVNPPQSKEWAPIQKMAIQIKMIGEELDIAFIVNLKKLSFNSNSSTTVDEVKEIKRILGKKDYEIYGSVNQDGIRKIIEEMLNEVKLKPMM